MSNKKLVIGLYGFGCVGSGLYEVLEKSPTLKATIKKICVKNKEKQRSVPADRFTFDRDELLNDPDINVIVELIDDADTAFYIVSTALRKGKAVVSANKKMIAEHFNELLKIQKETGTPFLYEAACCASIPIIRNLEEYYDNDLLESISGIVNGSTNYILTKTSAENLSYSDALSQAQKLGFAESNPILDTGGYDAKYKLLILLAHAFGIVVQPSEIINYGIDRISDAELKYAREKGFKIKLIAQAYKVGQDQVAAFVMPKFIPASDKLYSVDDVFNGVMTQSSFSDQQFFVGKGAGALPTASAVLSDISALRYRYRYEYKKLNNDLELKSPENIYLKVFLRHPSSTSLVQLDHFLSFEEHFTTLDIAYTVGVISLSKLEELRCDPNLEWNVVLIDEVKEKYIRPLRRALLRMDFGLN